MAIAPLLAKTEHLHSWHHDLAEDAKQEIIEAVGNIDHVEVVGSQVLLGVYIRPSLKRVTGGGSIIMPQTVTDEDIWQGKTALLLKLGHAALPAEDDPHRATFLRNWGARLPEVGDWLFTDVKQTFAMSVRGEGAKIREDRTKFGDWDPRKGWACRLVYMKDVWGRVLTPEIIV